MRLALCRARLPQTARPSSCRPLQQRDRPRLPPSIGHAALKTRAAFPPQHRIHQKCYPQTRANGFLQQLGHRENMPFHRLFLAALFDSRNFLEAVLDKTGPCSGGSLESSNINNANLSVTSLCWPPLPPLVLPCAVLPTKAPINNPLVCVAFSRCFSLAFPLQQRALAYTWV